jgi:hypothetical protein
MALTSVRPMRPPAPATISRMSAMDQLLQINCQSTLANAARV